MTAHTRQKRLNYIGGVLFSVLLCAALVASPGPAPGGQVQVQAQAQAEPTVRRDCGVVDAIGYPLPADQFWVRYGFGMPSRRFNDRLHAGQDWFAREGPSLGQPVRVVARGRVTLASPTVWGTDKGMVIVEHTMPDGSIWYSVYGHIDELNGYTFPRTNTCVELGDIIGAIGDATPSPHLHFEIRNFWPFETGPGYWPVDPETNGWANPTEFIVNWQVWLRGAHRWHFDLWHAVHAPAPALVGDNGMLFYFDGNGLFVVAPSGQYAWYEHINGDKPMGLVRSGPERITISLADGAMQD
ncbi:MAG: M23 family metallopeptidase, partial [Anaerolineae bacterium]|nr:M23 family metallopeptidase [Anaerolineae bacterium]